MTTTKTFAPRRGRRLIAALSTLALPAVLAGCAVFSPMATENIYNPGDGINADLGAVTIRDLLVVGSGEDEPATIVGYVINNSDNEVTVTFTGGSGPASVTIPARSAQQVSPAGEAGLSIDPLGVPLGSIVPLQVTVDGNPAASIGAPSVSTEHPMYTGYAG